MGYYSPCKCHFHSGITGEHLDRVDTVKGKIIKGVAGSYDVKCIDGRLYTCKAKGSFRKDGIKPLIGDDVVIDIISDESSEGNITEILDRRNRMIRPAVANIDMALIVAALKNPDPNFLMLDKLILHFKQQNLPVVLCFNKEDIAGENHAEEYADIYRNSGCDVYVLSAELNRGIDELRGLLKGRTACIAGPSGVGKSTIINALQDNVTMETGDISKKLKRGKHTTRHSEIIPIDDDTFIIDTPGFTSIDVFDIEYDGLKNYYEEFADYEQCYFAPCSHIHEPNCGVREALAEGKISRIRYDNYCHIYEELKKKRKRK